MLRLTYLNSFDIKRIRMDSPPIIKRKTNVER